MTTSNMSSKLNVLVSYMALSVLTLLACLVTRMLIVNSHFTIDFENLLVFPLTSYLYLGCIISLSLILFLFGIWQNNFVKRHNPTNGFRLGSLVLSNALVAGLLFVFPSNVSVLWSSIGIASFTLLIDLFSNPKEKNLTWLITWTIIFSGFLSVVLFDGYLEYDKTKRIEIAQSMYNEVSDEALLDFQSVQGALKETGFISQFLSVPKPFKIHRSEFNQVNDHILDPMDEDRYDYIFNAYDKEGESMIYESYTAVSYYETFRKKSDTIQEQLYFDPIKNAYLSTWTMEIEDDELSPYTMFLEQYPQGSHINSYKRLGKYDYAFFKGDMLASTSNPFILAPSDNNMNLSIGESIQVNRTQYNDLYLQVSDQNLIKLSRKSARLIKPISLFSFLFVYIALILGAFTLVNQVKPIIPKFLTFKVGKWNSLKHKLQLSIISLIVFSFLIIGIVTIVYFQNLSSEYDKDLLKEKAYSVALELESRFSSSDNNNIKAISEELAYIGRQHHSELNLYNPDGDLLFSTVPKVYEKGIYDTKLDFAIVGDFAKNGKQMILDFDSPFMGLNYQHAYFPLLNASGKISLIVQNMQVPIIKTHSKVSDFVGTLLNIYVFLFLLSGALALMVSHSITQPLKRLGEKIKRVKLGNKNSELVWTSNDEIGQLVTNYNEMVNKLDDSAKMIAQTERDMAWREMAKQVAHEIKNPLTPMKLSIQYLQRAIDQRPEETTELVDRVSKTLIEQIDNLSNIAGAFSNFGKMPQSDNEQVILNEVLEAVHDLFRKRSDMDINMYEPIDELYVFADRNALIRILNNLVKNAIQAIPTERRGHIDIKLYKEDKQAFIKISDNGIGIPDSRKDKVFLPNFTTKSSGTGLGLAICANMVESFNGRLSFDSTEGQGTDFYLQIPLMHVNDNFVQHERVVLE